jgi:predicted Zn finger-like uncharacterized protein
MLTTCTACGTQFRVNTTQLRSVHGLVRCSRCHSVFDAFETLREEFEAATPTPQLPDNQPSTLNVSAEPVESPSITATDDASTVDDIDSEIHMQAAKPSLPADDLFADLWGESPMPPTETGAREDHPEPVTNDTPTLIEDHIPKPPALARDQALYKHKELPPRQRPIPKTPRQPWHMNLWGVGVGIMALLLGVQVVNAQRLALSQTPVVGAVLKTLYSALGNPIAPLLAPNQWLVSNINVTSDPDTAGALSITGTLANGANLPQTWPILRVELLDRYGDPLRARDFSAKSYLSADQAAGLLNAGAATRFRIDVVDPGPEAVGFQVQPCFDADGNRTCASATTE